jgi:hypothetical protein
MLAGDQYSQKSMALRRDGCEPRKLALHAADASPWPTRVDVDQLDDEIQKPPRGGCDCCLKHLPQAVRLDLMPRSARLSSRDIHELHGVPGLVTAQQLYSGSDSGPG